MASLRWAGHLPVTRLPASDPPAISHQRLSIHRSSINRNNLINRIIHNAPSHSRQRGAPAAGLASHHAPTAVSVWRGLASHHAPGSGVWRHITRQHPAAWFGVTSRTRQRGLASHHAPGSGVQRGGYRGRPLQSGVPVRRRPAGGQRPHRREGVYV